MTSTNPTGTHGVATMATATLRRDSLVAYSCGVFTRSTWHEFHTATAVTGSIIGAIATDVDVTDEDFAAATAVLQASGLTNRWETAYDTTNGMDVWMFGMPQS